MRIVFLAAAASLAAISAGASAAITVIGSSAARMCYEAAEAQPPIASSDTGDCDEALAQANLSLADLVATHVNRGILRSRGANITGSLADFDRALALDPNEPEAYLNKALVLTMKADAAGKAVPLFTAALEKKTKRPELAYFGRAAAKEELGDLKAAYYDYQRAVTADPKWAAPKVELARFSVQAK